MINMKENEDLEKLKNLAREIAKNEKKWEIIKELDDTIDFDYDWIHFESILTCRRINTIPYLELIKKMENKDLLKLLRKYVFEFMNNKS